MHVAIVGAGALGCVYGVRLAKRAGCTVSFVVRPSRAASTEPIAIEAVKGGLRETIGRPIRTTAVRGDADVVLLAVGTEDLDAIRELLAATEAPIVVLTPMMPDDWRRVRAAFGERAHAAMPSVISYANDDGVFRYWIAQEPTRIDEPRSGASGVAVRALARALDEADLPSHLELGVHETNPASTVCWIPIGMALALADGWDALAADAALSDLTARACSEGVALARTIGRPLPGATLAPLLARPLALRLARRVLSAEAIHYGEVHFGRKLRAQHAVMAGEMAALCRARGLPHAALDDLAARLAVLPSSP